MTEKKAKGYLIVFTVSFLFVMITVFVESVLYKDPLDLPPPAISNSLSFNEKAAWLTGRLHGGCEILSIGSSMTLNNISSRAVKHNFPQYSYINAASWGMSIKQTGENLKLLLEFCSPKIVLLNTRIRDFKGRDWFLREKLLRDMWGGTNKLLIHFLSFSFNYYNNNAEKIRHYRTTRNEYVSLAFDDFGGVSFPTENFIVNPRRWVGSAVSPDFHPSKEQYELLRQIANTVRIAGGQLVVMQSPIRPAVLDDVQLRSLDLHWQSLEKMAKLESFKFINYGLNSNFLDHDFVDSTHLNGMGAYKFTNDAFTNLGSDYHILSR